MKISQEKWNGKRPACEGFSLVEVSVAMAIAAVALVTLIGLIPQGLKTMQDAADQAIGARIHQQALSELQLTPFRNDDNSSQIASSPLKAFHRQIRLYDAQGVELGYQKRGSSLTKANPSQQEDDIDFNWSYTARIWIPAFAGDRGPVSLGNNPVMGDVTASSSSITGSPELMTVIVEIVPFKIPGDSFSSSLSSAEDYFDDELNFRRISTYQTTIVRMGLDYQ